MALRSCRNPRLARHSDLDELGDSPEQGTPTAPSDAGPSDAPVLTPALAKYTKGDLQRITKLCMDSFLQVQADRPEPAGHREGHRKGQLKARFPDLYHGESHMESYHFCQQCEDHFATAGATGSNRTPFAASFLRGRISFRWHQHKRRNQAAEAPLPWIEFKAFLRKSIGDSRSFVDTIWNKIRRDSQYQQEEVQDWASHLEHLQSILIEFDADGAPEESTLIRYFRDGLKPSIKAQMEQRGREKDSWEELVEKTIDAEAKASLQPSSFVRDMDQRCPQGSRPAHATVAKLQASWDPRNDSSEKAPAQHKPPHSSHPYSSRSENGETSEKNARKEKKKRHRREQARRGSISTSANGVNTTNVNGRARRELSQITFYNCREKGHYARNCSEPQRDASED